MATCLANHKQTILIADDEPSVRQLLKVRLSLKGYTILTAQDGQETLDIVNGQALDLLILDIMMPKVDGYTVCKTLREKSQIPIIMLTALCDVSRRLAGLKLGADDYLVKPFSPRELEARIDCILRRLKRPTTSSAPMAGVIKSGPLSVDLNTRQVHKGGERLRLTGLEFSLLELLVGQSGKAISRQEILKQVWGINTKTANGLIDSRVIDVHISRLRSKIEDDLNDPEYILTIRGEGYQFQRLEA